MTPRSVILLLATAAGVGAGCARRSYRLAEVDRDGQLRITTSGGQTLAPSKDSGQVAFDQVALSPDGGSVGWLAVYPNCCTQYPLALKLVVRTGDTTRTFTGEGLPIWRWSFTADGRRVALRQAPVHGGAPSHFELREISTGRLVGSFEGDLTNWRDAPAWVRTLQAPP